MRRLTREEAGEVLTLQRAAFLSEARAYATTEIPPLLESLDELQGALESSFSLGSFLGARLVGALRLRTDGTVGWISRVAVAPDQQGRGIASNLLDAIEASAPATVREFRLVAGSKSTQNLSMYEHRGFRELERVIDEVGIELVVMRKDRS